MKLRLNFHLKNLGKASLFCYYHHISLHSLLNSLAFLFNSYLFVFYMYFVLNFSEEGKSGVYKIDEDDMRPEVVRLLLDWMYLKDVTASQADLVVSSFCREVRITE
jgi:hypothetical protein